MLGDLDCMCAFAKAIPTSVIVKWSVNEFHQECTSFSMGRLSHSDTILDFRVLSFDSSFLRMLMAFFIASFC